MKIMTNNYSSVTFRYCAIFLDGRKQYFFDMSDLRKRIKKSDLSNISYFEKYYKNTGWVLTCILFKN